MRSSKYGRCKLYKHTCRGRELCGGATLWLYCSTARLPGGDPISLHQFDYRSTGQAFNPTNSPLVYHAVRIEHSSSLCGRTHVYLPFRKHGKPQPPEYRYSARNPRSQNASSWIQISSRKKIKPCLNGRYDKLVYRTSKGGSRWRWR